MIGNVTGKAEFPVPTHAYIPRKTPRHPEDTFSLLCNTVQPGDDIATLTRSDAWRCGLEWLHAGYYWEAHELFESVWMVLPQNAPERRLVQALIQLANAGLKTRMGKPKAAARLLEIAERLLAECKAGGGDVRMALQLDMPERWIEEMRAK